MPYELLRIKNEAARCLLCLSPSCEEVCPAKKPLGRILNSVRFENLKGARFLIGDNACSSCSAPCVQACRRNKIDRGIDIPSVISDVCALEEEPFAAPDIDLSVDLCGVKCENPFFLSSSVVCSNYEMTAKAFKAGWAGAAFKTIGKMEINEASPRFSSLEKEGNSFTGFKNIEQISDHPYEENLRFISQLKKDFPEKIIIASIMGRTEDEWTEISSDMEKAGADVIECNFSCPQMTGEDLGSDVGTNLELVSRYTAAVRRGTKLPILAKMTPNIMDMTEPAKKAIEAGADGIAAINTIKSIMNVDMDTFVSAPSVDGKTSVSGYSGKAVKPIALRFINDMKQDEAIKSVHISGMGGIETWKDAAEFIALGCGTLQITTAVMQYGYRIIDDLIDGMKRYLNSHGFKSVKELEGKGLSSIVSPESLDRETIQYPKFIRNKCVSCGRCYISCYDGGHQAITINDKKQPMLNPKKCAGCQLCVLVCPAGAITAGTRVKKIK